MDTEKSFPTQMKIKNAGFKVPNGYFESFSQSFDEEVLQLNKKRFQLRKLPIWVYAAAVFIGVIFLVPSFQQTEPSSSEVSNEYYESYVLSQVQDYDLMYYSSDVSE